MEKRKAPDGAAVPGDLIGNIMGGLAAMPATAPKRPRPAERNMGGNPFQTMAARLHQIRDTMAARMKELGPDCVVEIEAKLGLIVDKQSEGRTGPFTPGAGAIEILPGAMTGKRFVSGVTKKDFEIYQRVQEAHPSCQKSRALTHAYTFENDTRVQTDAEGKVILEQKTRELEFQIHLPSQAYDCRITVSLERALLPSEAPQIGSDWRQRRLKDRCSYGDGRHGNPQRSKWQADLTRVTTVHGPEAEAGVAGSSSKPQGEQTFEVELELKADDCSQWIQLTDAKAAHERTCEVALDLWSRLCAMMPQEETCGGLVAVTDAALEAAGQRACLAPFEAMDAAAGSSRVGTDFPGTLPIGFSRGKVPKVQTEKYWVSEKTDGVRHFVVVVQPDERQGKPVALLFDRKFKAWTMDGMEDLGMALGVGTCLDGEVVRNRSWKRDIFMVFDCMSVEHASCAALPFSKRLHKLQTEVLGHRYLKYLARSNEQVHSKMKMLPLVMKHFYPTAKIHDITRHIRWEGAERVYLELDDQGRAPKADHKRHHKSDGLIFAPELPYHRGTDFNYMKWKWHDTITLDFECRREPHAKYGVALSFACEGGQVDFTDHIVMEEQDRARLLGDMASVVRSSGAPGALITEWEWSPECSGWIYKMPRPDKKKSNFSRTVLATIMELAEGMDIEELEYRLSCARPQDDNWAEALAERRRALLAERRRSVATGR